MDFLMDFQTVIPGFVDRYKLLTENMKHKVVNKSKVEGLIHFNDSSRNPFVVKASN